MFKIHRFPTLKMLVYNYTSGMFDEFDYEGPQFDLNGYVKMKEFLNKFALKSLEPIRCSTLSTCPKKASWTVSTTRTTSGACWTKPPVGP
jgi:hypothetical protein